MGALSNFTEIGRIVRSQGLKGEVKVDFISDNPDLVDTLDLVYTKNHLGDFMPLRIKKIRSGVQSGNVTFFVTFEQIAERNKADQLKGYPLLLEQDKATEWLEEPDVLDFEDFTLFDHSDEQEIGEVLEVMETAAHPILVCQINQKEVMIPLVDEYVVSIDVESEYIYCQNLDQLLEES